MKKILPLIVLAAITAGVANAQYVSPRPARNYINLAYATQKLKFDDFISEGAFHPGYTVTSDYGMALEFGHTFFMHQTPLAGMVRIGLDLSYLDFQYASCKTTVVNSDLTLGEADAHFGNFGMQFGPSVTVSPMDKLNLKAYVHYAPSAVAFSSESLTDAKFGYAGYITGGIQASYTFVTLGVEMRGGTSKLYTANVDTETFNKDEKVRTKLPSTRFIVGFRF